MSMFQVNCECKR